MESQGIASLEKMLVGFGFHPTEEELVHHYLKHKLLGDHSLNQIIAEVDVCKVEPWDLPAFSKVKSDDPEWFFFSPRNLKYTNSNRSNRATKAGYWKVTGKDRKIKTRGTNIVIGTNWVIHEYHSVRFDASQRNFVLCRLMEKAEKKAKEGKDALINHESEPSNHMVFDSEDPEAIDRIQDYSLPKVNLETIFQPEEDDFLSIEQEPSFPSYYNGNRNSNIDFHVETTGEEDNIEWDIDVDDMLRSFFTNDDVSACEETSHAPVGGFTPSKSLRGGFTLSKSLRGTETELVSSKYGNILDRTSALCNEHGGLRESKVNNITELSHGAGQAGTSVLSSSEVNYEQETIFLCSDDLPADKHLPANIFIITVPSPPATRRCETKYHSRSDNLVSQKSAATRFQTLSKVTASGEKATTSEGVDTSSNDLPVDIHYPKICVIRRVSSPSPSLPASETEEASLNLDADVEEFLRPLITKKEYDFPFPPIKQEPSFQHSPPAPRRCKTKCHSRSDNLESQRSAASQTHKKVSNKAATTHEVKKERGTQESKKYQKKAQDTSSRKNTETTSSTSNGGNRKSSFTSSGIIPLLGTSSGGNTRGIPLLGTSGGGNTRGIPLLGPSPRPRVYNNNISEVLDRLAGFCIEDESQPPVKHNQHDRS